MDKKSEVKCECEGAGFIAVADNGGEGVEHFECGQHHPAYKADAGSRIGNIMQAAKEIERLASTDDLLAHMRQAHYAALPFNLATLPMICIEMRSIAFSTNFGAS